MDSNYILSSSVTDAEGEGEADPGQHYPVDDPGMPYYGGGSYSIQRFQGEAAPWYPHDVSTPEGQTCPRGNVYVPAAFPPDSPGSRVANNGSDEDVPPVEHDEEKDKKKKNKKDGKTDAKKEKEAKKHPKKGHGKDGDSKKKGHGHKGHKH